MDQEHGDRSGTLSRNDVVSFGAHSRLGVQEELVRMWAATRNTVFMVTHDVDEAILLSDRIALMTNGPEAEVGDILEVKFDRPRDRKAVMEHPDYYRMREHLITFLEERAHLKGVEKVPTTVTQEEHSTALV